MALFAATTVRKRRNTSYVRHRRSTTLIADNGRRPTIFECWNEFLNLGLPYQPVHRGSRQLWPIEPFHGIDRQINGFNNGCCGAKGGKDRAEARQADCRYWESKEDESA